MGVNGVILLSGRQKMRNADCGTGINGVILLSGWQKMRNAEWGKRRFREPETWPRDWLVFTGYRNHCLNGRLALIEND
jgi:hypothetical protein